MKDDVGGEWRLPGAFRDRQSVTRDWQPVDLELLAGVAVREVRPVVRRSRELTEIYRADWFDDELPVDQVFFVRLHVGSLSAWHAHAETTDRLFVVDGTVRIVLYDARQDSPSHGGINEFVISSRRPTLVVVPPKVWHGVENVGDERAILLNAVDQAYEYENPDHWRVDSDCPDIPFRFRD